MYKLLGRTDSNAQDPEYLDESPLSVSTPSEFLSDAVFAGGSFHHFLEFYYE